MCNFIPTSQAASESGLAPEYIRELCRKGRVRSQKFGHIVMVDKKSLAAHIESTREWHEKREKAQGDESIEISADTTPQ